MAGEKLYSEPSEPPGPGQKAQPGTQDGEGGEPQPPPRSAGATSGSGSTWTYGSGELDGASSAESSPQLSSEDSLLGDVAEHRVVAADLGPVSGSVLVAECH